MRFEDKKEFMGLQSADILAYELYREGLKMMGFDSRPQRHLFLRPIRNQVPSTWIFLDEEAMGAWSNAFETSIALQGVGTEGLRIAEAAALYAEHLEIEEWVGEGEPLDDKESVERQS
jgi:hypothetical protein